MLSSAIRVGNTVYVAGLVNAGPDVRGDVKAQTRGVMVQIQNLLKQADMDFADVVSTNVWLANGLNADPMNDVEAQIACARMVKQTGAHPIVLSGCRALIAEAADMTMLEARDAASAQDVFAAEKPDITVIDINRFCQQCLNSVIRGTTTFHNIEKPAECQHRP